MKRRKAREYALQFLYRIDFQEPFKGTASDRQRLADDLNEFWASAGEGDSEVRAFAEDIISGTLRNIEEIDAGIEKTAEKWKLNRIAAIDRNILRSAVYELLFRKDIPPAVSINEAIEIAKKYSTAEAAAFINGILDRIAKNEEQNK